MFMKHKLKTVLKMFDTSISNRHNIQTFIKFVFILTFVKKYYFKQFIFYKMMKNIYFAQLVCNVSDEKEQSRCENFNCDVINQMTLSQKRQ